MPTKRYQRGWAAASLRVMLASSLLMKRARPQLPGKKKRSGPGEDKRFSKDLDAAGFQTCKCGGEIVRGPDDSLYCQECARRVEDMQRGPDGR